MSTRRTEVAIWAVTAALAFIAALGWRSAPEGRPVEAIAVPPAALEPRLLDGDSLDWEAAHVVEHDPFRLERRPSDVPYMPGVESAQSLPPEPPAPTLVLTGIMGGPPWQGIIEGFPGVRGSTVVRQGQLVGDLRIVRVTGEIVVVESADTAWTLRVRRTW